MSDPNFYPQRGAGELQRFLQDARATLKSLDAQLQKAHDLLSDAEDRWTELYDETMGELEEQGNKTHNFPTEIRNSIVRRNGGGEAWANKRRAERMVKRLDKQVEMLEAQIRAAQSEGKIGV